MSNDLSYTITYFTFGPTPITGRISCTTHTRRYMHCHTIKDRCSHTTICFETDPIPRQIGFIKLEYTRSWLRFSKSHSCWLRFIEVMSSDLQPLWGVISFQFVITTGLLQVFYLLVRSSNWKGPGFGFFLSIAYKGFWGFGVTDHCACALLSLE